MAFLCDKCEAQFPQTPVGKSEWLEHRAEHKTGKAGKTATGEQIKKSMSAKEIKQQMAEEKKTRKAVKPKLTYRWEGECSGCFGVLDSIEIDAGQAEGKTVSVAFCSHCKKQVAYRPVKKL